ncbi:MAG: DUF1697 domain-containing protein [bacterium]
MAFLRGMNLGNRRIKNTELVAAFEDMGFAGAVAFQASGNVIFDGGRAREATLRAKIEAGLEERLGYPVPTLIRSAGEVVAIADAAPFDDATLATTEGRLQVILLGEAPDAATRAAIEGDSSDDDRLVVDGRLIYWLPRKGISDSTLSQKRLDRDLGTTTVRTHKTFGRLRGKVSG